MKKITVILFIETTAKARLFGHGSLFIVLLAGRLGATQQNKVFYDIIDVMNYRRLFELNSIIFITFVTFNRYEILIPNIQLLRYSFYQAKQKYQFDIIAICVLKNHIHMLIKPKNIIDYPNIIKNIKCNFSLRINISTIRDYSETESRVKKGEKSIWQRRYWEHTIRNEIDFNKHLDYIHYNNIDKLNYE